MGIYDKRLLGGSLYETTLDRMRMFCEGKRVLCAFSGGKDSQACYHLLEDAGVSFHAEYSVTRFEPPELMRFIRAQYPDVTFRRAYRMSLRAEIELCGLPNRWARWCCKSKHIKTDGYDISVIGIRWEESPARRESWRMFGVKQDKTAYLCPIADWTEANVWEYLEGRPHCSLYDEGYSRIGCVCCPLSAGKMQSDAARWPKTAAAIRKGSDAFVARMRGMGWANARGKVCSDWHLAEDPEGEYWRRWITTGQTSKPSATGHYDRDQCVFEGSGFSEADSRENDE